LFFKEFEEEQKQKNCEEEGGEVKDGGEVKSGHLFCLQCPRAAHSLCSDPKVYFIKH
jgi:hypothetical protein